MLSPTELRRRYPEAYEMRPTLYWLDLVLSAVVGWGAFGAALASPAWSLSALAFLVLAILGLYRGVLFIHEIAHLRRGAIPGFESAWNVLFGIPLQVPSLMYVGPHMEHHRATTYGTGEDPEYAPMASWSPLQIWLSILPMLAVPGLLVIRWGVVGPLAAVFPPLRRWAVGKASTLAINASYTRKAPTGRDARRWLWLELGAGAASVALLVGLATGVIPWIVLGYWYVAGAAILTINHFRTLAAHRYENYAGGVMTGTSQLLDSVNLSSPWTILIAPVGLRYHALHHMAPAIPYHQLGRLHRKLIADLPDDSPYRQAEAASPVDAMARLLRRDKDSSAIA